MTYDVAITNRAERHLKSAAAWIAVRAPTAAQRWFDKFIERLLTLRHNPQRCGVARENDLFPYELRELLYGRRRSYRALFTIRDRTVVVLAIWHSARRDFTPDDLLGD